MIGYVILAKRVNEFAEGGFDYMPVSEVFVDSDDADYVLSGLASPPDEVVFIIREIDCG